MPGSVYSSPVSGSFTVPQHMERPLRIQFFDQRGEQQWFQNCRVQGLHLGPELGLRVLNEGEHLRGEQSPFLVPFRVGAGFPATAC